MKDTSILLNDHFEEFVNSQVIIGNYNSVSEVIHAALRLLEEHEMKVQRLTAEIQKGLDSGTITGEEHHERFAKKRAAALKTRGIKQIAIINS